MVQLITVLGISRHRKATFILACPMCHKRRTAKHVWYRLETSNIAVCADCKRQYKDRSILEQCKKQGWCTVLKCFYTYDIMSVLLFM